MKKSLLVVVICACALFFSQTVNAAPSQNVKKDAGYISLNGSTVKEVEPNIARITFAVENTGSNAQTATEENAKISKTIVDALKLIITENTDTIKTSNFAVTPVFATQNGKRVIKNYTAVNSVTIETKEISKITNFIDTAIASGANRVNGLTYGLMSEKEVCSELYQSIIKELKAEANILAQAAGTSLDGLKHMNTNCSISSNASNTRVYSKSIGEGSVDMAVSTPVESGKIKIRVYVNADFYVK